MTIGPIGSTFSYVAPETATRESAQTSKAIQATERSISDPDAETAPTRRPPSSYTPGATSAPVQRLAASTQNAAIHVQEAATQAPAHPAKQAAHRYSIGAGL